MVMRHKNSDLSSFKGLKLPIEIFKPIFEAFMYMPEKFFITKKSSGTLKFSGVGTLRLHFTIKAVLRGQLLRL